MPTEPPRSTVHRFEPAFRDGGYESSGSVLEVEMPAGAQILKATEHGLYAIVLPDAEKVTRRFLLISTGHPIDRPDVLRYIETPTRGRHLFEIVEPIN